MDAPTRRGGTPASPAHPGGERGGSAGLFLRLRPVLFLALWAWFLLGLYLRAHGREPFFGLLAPGFDGGGPAPGAPATYSTFRFFLPGERRADGTVGLAEEVRVAIPLLRQATEPAAVLEFWICEVGAVLGLGHLAVSAARLAGPALSRD